MSHTLKANIQNLIASGNLEDAVEEFFIVLKNESELKEAKEIYSSLIHLSGSLQTVLHHNRLGLISNEDFMIARNRLQYSVLDLINITPEAVWMKSPGESAISLREKIVKATLAHEFEYDLFISYASSNFKLVYPIIEKLRGYGLRVFASDEIMQSHIGDSYFDRIGNALQSSKDFLLICTADSLKSKWVKSEYETFYNQFHISNELQRRFFILNLERINISLIPILFRRLQIASSSSEILKSIVRETHSNINNPGKPNSVRVISFFYKNIFNKNHIKHRYHWYVLLFFVLSLGGALLFRDKIISIFSKNKFGSLHPFNITNIHLEGAVSIIDYNKNMIYEPISKNNFVIPLSDKTLLSIGSKGYPSYDFYYKADFGDKLNLKVTKNFLYCNNQIVSIYFNDNANFLARLDTITPNDIKYANSITFEIQNNSDTKLLLPKIVKLARINPNMGFSIHYKNNSLAEAYLKNALPKWLFINTSKLLEDEEYENIRFEFPEQLINCSMKELTNLEWLSFFPAPRLNVFTGIIDLSNITRLPKLSFLAISADNIDPYQFSDLKYVENLHTLNLSGKISSVRAINEFKGLKELILTRFQSGDFVFDIPGLENFQMYDDTISPLRYNNLKKLSKLYQIKLPRFFPQGDLDDVLKQNKNLIIIDISTSEYIYDLTSIEFSRKLRGIHLGEINNYHSLTPLERVKNLKYIGFSTINDENPNKQQLMKKIKPLLKKNPDLKFVGIRGFCLGSGWILFIIPCVLLLTCVNKYLKYENIF